MKNKIVMTPDARADLSDIKKYICVELKNPQAADAVLNRIGKSIEMLKTYAFAGAALCSITKYGKDYHYLVSGNYLIFYKVGERKVFIEHVLYGRQDYLKKLFPSEYTGEFDEK